MSKEIQRFDSSDVKIESIKPLYNGFFNMVEYKFRHKLFEGGWSETVRREMFERGHAVAVLPYDPVTQEFVLVEQIRIGAMATSSTPWLLEVVAGIIDEGENAAEVCHREAQEEAGITLQNLTEVTSYLASPGGTTERIHIFVAQTDSTEAEGVHGLACESEDILVHRIKEEEAFNWLNSGKIDNAASIIALQWFFLNRTTLLDNWKESGSSIT